MLVRTSISYRWRTPTTLHHGKHAANRGGCSVW